MRISNCHPDEKYYAKGLCRKCYEKQLRKINPKYAKRQKKNSAKWHNHNKDRKKAYDRQRKKWIGPQTDKRFFSYILRKYGVTKEKYAELLAKSNNRCYICDRKPAKGKRIHLDHNHETMEVRGLLCAQCNWYLGFIEKDPTIIQKIKDYLKL